MRITDVEMNESIASTKGLQPIKMPKIDNVVLLAGKNGAGKTRLLNLVREYADPEKLHRLSLEKNDVSRRISNYQEEIKKIEQAIQNAQLMELVDENTLKNRNSRLSNCENEINKLKVVYETPMPIAIDGEHKYIVTVEFVPHISGLEGYANKPRNQQVFLVNRLSEHNFLKVKIYFYNFA